MYKLITYKAEKRLIDWIPLEAELIKTSQNKTNLTESYACYLF